MKMKRRLARVAAGAAALAVGAVGAIGIGVAQADPDPDPLPSGNIDFTYEDGTLTLHKYLVQTESGIHGNPKGDVTGTFDYPVENAEFTIYPLLDNEGDAVNLEDPGTWNHLAGLKPSQSGTTCEAPTGYQLGNAKAVKKTNYDGDLTFTDLGVGVYVVCETDIEGVTVEGDEGYAITQLAAPFVAVIPTPFENEWLYDVHAYPKNRAFHLITKSILDQEGLTLGSNVRFEISVDVPPLNQEQNQTWEQGAIADIYDSRLGVPANPVESVKVGGDTFSEGTDYTVVTRDTDEGKGRGVGIEFTQTALNEFSTGKYTGQTVKVIFLATVEEIGNGVIENQAGLWTNVSGFELEDGDWKNAQLTSSEVSTSWGDAAVFKYAKGTDPKETLADATFEVYEASNPYPGEGECEANIPSGAQPLNFGTTADPETKFTTGSDGTLTIPGLYVSDTERTSNSGSLYRCYVLKEVGAPAGFVLPGNDLTALEVRVGQTTDQADVEISNSKQAVPDLPVTGAAGKLLLMLAGLAAAAIVVGAVLANKRKTKEVLG